jgi:hypothetical protein
MARVLAPTGRLALAEPTADIVFARIADHLLRHLDASHVRLYRSRELKTLAEAAGFTAIAIQRLESRGYVILSGSRDGSG